MVLITTGNIQDRDGGKMLMLYARRRFVRLRHVWADGGYLGKLVTWTLETLNWTLEIIKRSDKAKGFQVLTRRWVVERSLAWLTRSR
ncbi:transposase [Deinococcus sp. SM5_A1]|uniref:transposase n=1 Tax=Deinococcus sp. SM5_A1 TaxID=3379094 RepID=UPI00385C4D52